MFFVRGQLQIRLGLLGFGFLETDDVGVEILDEWREEPLFANGPNAVDVPRDEAHLENVATVGILLVEV